MQNAAKREVVKKAIDVLRKYIEQAEPEINQKLRGGDSNPDLCLIDNLFEHSQKEMPVFRGMDNQFVNINGQIFQDKAYLSTSSDIDNALKFSLGNPALLIIKVPAKSKAIDVDSMGPFEKEGEIIHFNNEGEIILPRNTILMIEEQENFSRLPVENEKSMEEFVGMLHKKYNTDLDRKAIDFEHLMVYHASVKPED